MPLCIPLVHIPCCTAPAVAAQRVRVGQLIRDAADLCAIAATKEMMQPCLVYLQCRLFGADLCAIAAPNGVTEPGDRVAHMQRSAR